MGLDTYILGVRLWIWLYLAISFFGFMGVIAYLKRELIRKIFYEMRFPEKIIKVVIHYQTGLFHEFYRLIPNEDSFNILGKTYNYNDKAIIRDNEIFAVKNQSETVTINVDGKKYNFTKRFLIKPKLKPYPEIHYFYNIPNPIEFKYALKKIDFTASQLEAFKQNDLWKKLLTLEGEKSLLVVILFLTVGCILMNIFIIAKLFEWI